MIMPERHFTDCHRDKYLHKSITRHETVEAMSLWSKMTGKSKIPEDLSSVIQVFLSFTIYFFSELYIAPHNCQDLPRVCEWTHVTVRPLRDDLSRCPSLIRPYLRLLWKMIGFVLICFNRPSVFPNKIDYLFWFLSLWTFTSSVGKVQNVSYRNVRERSQK